MVKFKKLPPLSREQWVTIRESELMNAMDRWKEVTGDSRYGTTFTDFIGLKYWLQMPESLKIRVTVKAYRKMQMLLGPHYKTIIKAWQIRNELHDKLPESKKPA
jgi:hypothetical protein